MFAARLPLLLLAASALALVAAVPDTAHVDDVLKNSEAESSLQEASGFLPGLVSGLTPSPLPLPNGYHTMGWPAQFTLRPKQQVGQEAMCMDAGENPVEQQTLRLHTCHGGSHQTFEVRNAEQIQLAGTDLCLDVEQVHVKHGSDLYLFKCHHLSNQKFQHVMATSGIEEMEVMQYTQPGVRFCVTAMGTTDQSNIEMHQCEGKPDQSWEAHDETVAAGGASLASIANLPKLFMLRPGHADLCLSAAHVGHDANIVLKKCKGLDKQVWTVDPEHHRFRLAVTKQAAWTGQGLCLDLATAHSADEANMQLHNCHLAKDQQFEFADANAVTAGQATQIYSLASTPRHCLDVDPAHTTHGSNVQVFSCEAGVHQLWTVVPHQCPG